MQVVANSWRKLGVDVTTHTQDINSIYGANGYQFNRKMTAGAYSWFNNDDPDDRFYWNSIDIPKTPTGTGGDAPEYFYQISVAGADRQSDQSRACTDRSGKTETDLLEDPAASARPGTADLHVRDQAHLSPPRNT